MVEVPLSLLFRHPSALVLISLPILSPYLFPFLIIHSIPGVLSGARVRQGARRRGREEEKVRRLSPARRHPAGDAEGHLSGRGQGRASSRGRLTALSHTKMKSAKNEMIHSINK